MNNSTKERPILFSVDMIRALIREYQNPGQCKNQTRRTRGLHRFNGFPSFLKDRGWEIKEFIEEEPGLWLAISNNESGEFPDVFNPWVKCPYGKTGNRLWVRETFCYKADDSDRIISDRYWYRASSPDVRGIDHDGYGLYRKDGSERSPWIPSIHMPRKASRILLEITEIKIERLQEITWRAAQLEGIECVWHDDYTSDCLWKDYTGKSTGLISAKESYFSLWEKINGPDSVVLNPWVWVIKFKVLTINGKLNEKY